MTVDGEPFQTPGEWRDWIDQISIRGRMAYGLLCIEKAQRAFAVHSKSINTLLGDLWKFTSMKRLDEWEQEILPWRRFIAAFEDDCIENEEWREFAAEWGIGHLDLQRQKDLGRMLMLAEKIGGDNLYSAFNNDTTAAPLFELIEIMTDIGVPLPGRGGVSMSKIEEKDGWGELRPREFYREDLS